MLAAKSMDVQDNFKNFCDKVFQGETLIVSRPKNENVVMLSEREYNGMLKAMHNAEYLAMLDESFKQLENGKTISFTMEELEAMECDDWTSTPKVLDWMKKTGKTEPLKHRPGDSRRMDEANRLIYEIDELQNIRIISCKGHYED